MKIEVGKRYWRRDSGISPVVESTDDKEYPFVAGDESYTEAGEYYGSVANSSDLVAEYTGPELVPPGEKVKRTIVLKEVLVRYDEYWMHGWEAGGKFPGDKLVPPDEVVYTGLERVVEV